MKGLLRALSVLVGTLMAVSALSAVAAPRFFRDCPECPEMVDVPAGRFVMGSPDTEPGRFDSEGPQHEVVLAEFALGRTVVTVGEFSAFVKATHYEAGPCQWPQGVTWRSPLLTFSETQPVVCVSARDAEAYIAWLNGHLPPKATPYRLPSEAEWEYAARAGSSTARWWGDAIGVANANCNGCGSAWDNRDLAPVGSFPANPFGLNDMLGNVWQWTADCWNESYAGAPHDGSRRTTGDCGKRVLRGGSWSSLPVVVRSASRTSANVDDRDADFATYTGFRVARSLP